MPIYLFIRIRFSFTYRKLQVIRFLTCLFLSLGASFYFSKEAIDSGPGAMALFFVFFPPYSMVMYGLGAATVTFVELLVLFYQNLRKKPLVTKDNHPQTKGFLNFWVFTLVCGIMIPLIIFGGLLISVF